MPKAKHARDCRRFQDIPNIGPAMAADFELMGYQHPAELAGCNPYKMYDDLCRLTKCRQDPCVYDVFIAAVRFMEGDKSRPWWHFTPERKRTLAARARAQSDRTRESARRAAPPARHKPRGSRPA
jgi:hypothetical protein